MNTPIEINLDSDAEIERNGYGYAVSNELVTVILTPALVARLGLYVGEDRKAAAS